MSLINFYIAVPIQNKRIAVNMVRVDPFDKSEKPLTETEKANIDWRASDVSNDSQDEKVQKAKNYEELRDPEVYQKQERIREQEKAEEERQQRRKERQAEKERERKRREAERAANAALDKAAKAGRKPAKGKPPAKGKHPTKPAKPPAKPTKAKAAKKATEPLPKPTRRIAQSHATTAARKVLNRVVGKGRKPVKPVPSKKKAKKVNKSKTKKEWRALYKIHSAGRREASKHLTQREKDQEDREEVNLRHRFTADGRYDLTCPMCPQRGAFANMTSLQNHYNRRHKQEYNYECDQCYKSFATKGTLTAHKKFHNMSDQEK